MPLGKTIRSTSYAQSASEDTARLPFTLIVAGKDWCINNRRSHGRQTSDLNSGEISDIGQ